MSDKYSSVFTGSKTGLSQKLKNIFTGSFDEKMYDEFVEELILADVPYETAEKIMDGAKKRLSKREMDDFESIRTGVKESMLEIFASVPSFELRTPAVVLVFGVNGVGKTTTIAKLTKHFSSEGKTVMLAAADTFRAAACEQLTVWAERLNVKIVKSAFGQDPSGVVFDAIASAKAKNCDILLCDTAGRLHNNDNLMEELRKIVRVADKNKQDYNLYSVLVVDAMSGRNTLVQTKSFSEITNIDAVILSKTDSSAKGGAIIGIADEYKKNIWFVGTGEKAEDLKEFDPNDYVNAVFI